MTVQSLKATLDGLDNDRQRTETIQDLVKAKRLTPDVYKAYYASTHPTLGKVDLPPLVAPVVNPNGPTHPVDPRILHAGEAR
jgi:hypothetical protein